MAMDVRVEITANIVAAQKPQSWAEFSRDMHHIAPMLAAADTEMARHVLTRVPTVTEYLQASRKGDKKLLEQAFANKLSVCAAVASILDTYRTVLATPMGDGMARFCNSNVGLEVFMVNMAYEMSLSACFAVHYYPGSLGRSDSY